MGPYGYGYGGGIGVDLDGDFVEELGNGLAIDPYDGDLEVEVFPGVYMDEDDFF
jgi:hypothetical protein